MCIVVAGCIVSGNVQLNSQFRKLYFTLFRMQNKKKKTSLNKMPYAIHSLKKEGAWSALNLF